MPLGAIIARADIMDWGPGSHASTFGGNPVSCVAALETIKLLEVCRLRNTPIITFVNKFDREVREPFELLEETVEAI